MNGDVKTAKASLAEYAIENIKEVNKKYGYEEAKKVAETWQRNIALNAEEVLKEIKNDK